MSEERLPDRRRSGTYLFVRPKTARRPRTRTDSTPMPGSEPADDGPLAGLSLPNAEDRPRHARLRYRRPRLDPEVLDGRLVFFLAPESAPTEQYRIAAQALVRERGGPKRLLVVGAAPGVGATVTAANLACALSEIGRATLVDAAPARARRTLTSVFGIRAPGPASLTTETLDLWLLSDRLALFCAPDLPSRGETRRRALDALAAAADFVLVDGLSAEDAEGVSAMREVVDGAILVVRPADLGTGRYERALDALQGVRVVGILLNGAGEADEVLRAGP